jgi:hypothetical protein
MDDYVKLKLFSRVLKTKPDFLENNFDKNYLSYESFEELSGLLNQFRGVLSIEAEGDDLFRMYELIKFNYDALLNGTLTKDNFVNPPQKKFRVDYQQDYTEYGVETGSDYLKAVDKDLALAFAQFDEYTGNFEYHFDDRQSHDGDSDNFEFTDAQEISESIKKSIKKVLKEQYSIFIKKHN